MRKIERSAAPEILKTNWKIWGEEYKAKKEENNSHSFTWKQVNNVKVNHSILPFLQKISDNHCHYCDGYPPGKADETIDHFKPKGKPEFYHLAYQWENLYLACADCQMIKKDNFAEELLRPDAFDFTFDRYFTYNYSNHEIEIHPRLEAGENDYKRAEITIQLLGFNLYNNPTKRRMQFERRMGNPNGDLLDFAFRFMFE